MRNLIIALAALLLISANAFADTCTGTVNVTSASTTVLPASDVVGGRHFLLIQNIGAVDANCAIGETATTSKGFVLKATGNGSVLFQATQGANGVFIAGPNGAVNCITASSTTNISVCDY